MRDPHVESLQYSAEPIGNTLYSNPPPLEEANDLCTLRLANGILVVNPKNHYATVPQAREAIEPFLRAWELDADLRGLGAIRFTYKAHTIIDRNPPPPPSNDQTIKATLVLTLEDMHIAASATVHAKYNNYPKPPTLSLRVTPDVETMRLRYRGYQAGREPLQSMAYCCLTLVEASAGGRSKAAHQYHIDISVLRKLGFLTTEQRGDAKTVRKFKARQPLQPLSGAEQAWIEAAIKALIRRMGEYRPSQPISQLSMHDLPPL
jgi:hypothetical protein